MNDSLLIPRSALKSNLWKMIGHNQLVVVNAARRMGKTTLMKGMAEKPAEGYSAFWVDLQNAEDGYGIAENLYGIVKTELHFWQRAHAGWKQNLKALSGLKIGTISLPEIQSTSWKSLVKHYLNAIITNNNSKIVVFFDEIPLLLHKAITRQGASEAAEVLNFLRSIGEQHASRLTFVYAGSLGLNHILGRISEQLSENPPMVNDAHVFSIPTLNEKEGIEVAKNLLESEKIDFHSDVPTEIWHQADGIPFYIRQITLKAFRISGTVTRDDILRIADEMINDPNDLLHIEKDHFLRLNNNDYYPEEIQEFIHKLLRVMSKSVEYSINTSELYDDIKEYEPYLGCFEKIVSALQQDHLLLRDKDRISFRFRVVRRSWVAHRTIDG